MVNRGDRARRPFWLHQVVEYLVGLVLIAQGLQSPAPVLPTLAGGLVLVNAAITEGPLSAFKFVGRRFHRVLDIVVIALVLVATFQPWVEVDAVSRLVLGMIAAVLASVWFYTDFAEKAERDQRRAQAASDRAEQIGRSAGRLAGNAVTQWRRRQD
ncbi:MAG TPA: hypothetical protein VGK49_02440 [Ilumatobacteraceae bacterium]